MLERKASFEFGTKSILYLFLVFALYGKASDAVHKEFGCEFSDKDYRIQRTNKEIPVYGNVSTLDSTSLPTDNTDIYVNIAEPLQKKLFSEPNIMNDVSLFTKFLKDYKNSPNKQTMEFFFNNYEIPFKPKEYYATQSTIGIRKTHDPASYLIQEFHTLKTYLAVIKKSVSPYLVSAYVDPVGIYFSSVPLTSTQMAEKVSAEIPNLVQKRVQDHIAGIIKLKASNRKGYILMDPGYANGVKLYHPFIVYVMEDGKPPHGEFITNPMNENLEFATGGGKGSSYILVKHNKAQSDTKYVLYYVEMSYCSFMENTVKANIARLNHGIVARSTNGTKQAYLTFKISSKDKTISLRNYKMEKTDETDITQMKESFSKSMENAFDLPTKEITVITNEFKYIQTNVIGNRQMMSDLNNIDKILNLDKEQRPKYPEPVKTQKSLLQKIGRMFSVIAQSSKEEGEKKNENSSYFGF